MESLKKFCMTACQSTANHRICLSFCYMHQRAKESMVLFNTRHELVDNYSTPSLKKNTHTFFQCSFHIINESYLCSYLDWLIIMMCWSNFCTTMFLWKQSVQGRWRPVCSGLCILAFPKWMQMVAEGSEDLCPFEILNNSDEQVLHRTWCTSLERIFFLFFLSAAKPTQSILLS